MSSMLIAAMYSGSPFVGGDYESQDVLIAMAWCCLKVQQTSLESEIFLSGSILVLDLVRHLSLEKLGKGAMAILQITSSLCWAKIQWLSARLRIGKRLSSSIRACIMISCSCQACSCISLGLLVLALGTIRSLA